MTKRTYRGQDTPDLEVARVPRVSVLSSRYYLKSKQHPGKLVYIRSIRYQKRMTKRTYRGQDTPNLVAARVPRVSDLSTHYNLKSKHHRGKLVYIRSMISKENDKKNLQSSRYSKFGSSASSEGIGPVNSL
jgi:hypothetical protein